MYQKLKENKGVFFLVKALLLYVLWAISYRLFLHEKSPIDFFLIDNITSATANILQIFGYQMMTLPADVDTLGVVGIDGSHGVLIGYPCNGLELFALFAGFVVAYPGNIKTKLWFIPLGLLSIHLLNIIRVIGLALLAYHAPEKLEFNHTYTFTFIVYSFVFVLWIIWALKLSGEVIIEDTLTNHNT
jgi:exosortase family protein XrtF